ncbi:ureidoglycolate lyase [Microterricola viridarii]|uniref:Ureidoglycolate hydrolase n=1 Tax=Microterricola viridarii TaxID=412690 RepID=A0A0X8E298_9MICO|nr:ureidoglycolate lyase [Microterricola viridarii]AMB58304.1 hypothetical protein AWU67_04920 [Microterricola viridarii]
MTEAASTLVAEPVSAAAFSPFGEYFDLAAGGDRVVTTLGDGWTDRRSLTAVLQTPGHLGFTLGAATPFAVTGMERHQHTREVLLCAAEPVVVAVAATPRDAPAAADLRAFTLQPGDVIVLAEGIWHTACHGIGKQAHYYWMATADDSIADEWVLPTGGAVTVEAAA